MASRTPSAKGPRIRVDPPGPKSLKARERRDRVITRGLRTTLPIEISRAQGPFVEDVDGNRYIDIGVGIGVHNVGHRPARAMAAAKRQLDRLTHICYMVATYEPYTELAEAMAKIAPRGLTKSLFLNSGSEAVENAVKIARAATKRPWIVSFKSAFHGRTLLDLSLTAKEKPYKEGFAPYVREILHADYPYPYRSPEDQSPDEVAAAAVDGIEDAVRRQGLDGQIGAVIAEPIQGEAGMIVPPPTFFPRLRKACDTHGWVLIDDEVQAGMGRTGTLWATGHWKTVPDILVSGKAVGAGLPFGGVTGKPAIMDAPEPGGLGGTFGGNPVVCAAALEAIDEIQKSLSKIPKVDAILRRRLGEMAASHPDIGEARGVGAMWALEFVKDRRTKEPDTERPKQVQREALRRGLLVLTAGYHNNCLRFLPPFNIPPTLLERSMDILDEALQAR